MMNNLHVLIENFTNGYPVEALDIITCTSFLCGILFIVSKAPVVSVFFLIGLFLSICGYLMILGINFIGLAYLLVYFGAVSILFFFILMLINLRRTVLLSNTSNRVPLAILINSFNLEKALNKLKSVLSSIGLGWILARLGKELCFFFFDVNVFEEYTHICSILFYMLMPLVVSSLVTLILFGFKKFKCKILGVSSYSLVGYLLCVTLGIFGRFVANNPDFLVSLQYISLLTVVGAVVRGILDSFIQDLAFHTNMSDKYDPVRYPGDVTGVSTPTQGETPKENVDQNTGLDTQGETSKGNESPKTGLETQGETSKGKESNRSAETTAETSSGNASPNRGVETTTETSSGNASPNRGVETTEEDSTIEYTVELHPAIVGRRRQGENLKSFLDAYIQKHEIKQARVKYITLKNLDINFSEPYKKGETPIGHLAAYLAEYRKEYRQDSPFFEAKREPGLIKADVMIDKLNTDTNIPTRKWD